YQLLNSVEERVAIQARRLRESQLRANEEPGLWRRSLDELRAQGWTEEEIALALPDIRVEPVLTAHPTEAKRPTILHIHRTLYLLMARRENQVWAPAEQEEIARSIVVALERLWRSGEVHVE